MSKDFGDAMADRPLHTPGGVILAMPMSFEDFDPKHPWRRAEPLTDFRAKQQAEFDADAAAWQAIRDRLDWSGYVAEDPAPQDDAPAEPDASTSASTLSNHDGDAADAEAEARRIRRARIQAEDWEARVAAVLEAAAEGRLDGFPTASEYKTWSDERIAALRADVERDMEGTLTDAELDGVLDNDSHLYDTGLWDDEGEVLDRLHPINVAMATVEEEARKRNEQEASTILAGLGTWRLTNATVTGTIDAAINGPVYKGLMLNLAHAWQVAETTASGWVQSADEIDRLLPQSWQVFTTGSVPWRAMRILHKEMEGLDPEFRETFDTRAAKALRTVSVPQLRQRLHEIREAVQARTAVERHTKAMTGMRADLEPAADGMAWMHFLLPAPEAVSISMRLDAAAKAAAATDEQGRSITALKAHIAMDLFDEGLFRDATPGLDTIAVPQRKGVQCKVGLLIPAMTAMGHRDEPAILEGYGPIDIETAKRLAGEATSWIKVLTDEVTGAVIDIGREKYRPTEDMRALLGVLDRGGRGPNTYRPPSQTQADHIIPFNQGLARGRTALENLVLLAIRDHKVKTSELWDIELRDRRDLAWTSWYGTRLITTVEPLPATPVPERFRSPAPPPEEPTDWADPDTPDTLDCPF